ncbi:MAG: hypothetical protein D6796_02035 [Caldilineae bacterium]|nr:MAG: hypothetical protein D6796_02035 [Caldilineae bacterium]
MAKIPFNAWQEVIARIFDGFAVQYNVTPDWLVNPATGRRLKLDRVYPEIGAAVRFQGMQARQRRARPDDAELAEDRRRDEARRAVCEEHGISLAILNLSTHDFAALFDELETALSRATRRLAKDVTRPPAEKAALLERLSRARSRVAQFRRTLHTDRDLAPYADLWQDRQYREAAPAEESPPAPPPPALQAGMRVEHTRFGAGVVTRIAPSGDDRLVTIDFGAEGERTFLASLLAGKLRGVRREA